MLKKGYCKSLSLVIFKFKCFWWLLFIIGLSAALWGAGANMYKDRNTICEDSLVKEIFIYGGGAFIGLASSALFSRQEQFLLRGARDDVYLVRNHPCLPRIYKLTHRECLPAFGGNWHEVQNVSEHFIRHLYCCCFGKELNLKEAQLYKLNEDKEKSIFAVLLDVRYGIPDKKTRIHIWKNKSIIPIDISEFDRWLPGNDLVSIDYWSEKDRGEKKDCGEDDKGLFEA